jgi:4-hydroxythreonine-4-phosphate dehydrogenase
MARARPIAPPAIALTMGEPAGIGGEIALKAWSARRDGVPPFVAIDDPVRLAELARRIGLDVPLATVDEPGAATAAFAEALPVLPVSLARPCEPGRPTVQNARTVIASLDRAIALARAGTVAAVVTNPIHKKTLYDAGFAHPGHTEYLGAAAGLAHEPVMMLVGGGLRVVPVTVHMALRAALDALTPALIVEKAGIAAAALARDFAIDRPRLAIAGVNPHAGEDGTMGAEDRDIVAPAVALLRRRGIDAFGPVPPDTMFHARARAGYDAAICMYHDQALIPLKTLAFDRGVNVTLGLPFVRTSPDHGTAFDIAGTGRADPASLIAALRCAAAIAAARARTAAPAQA